MADQYIVADFFCHKYLTGDPYILGLFADEKLPDPADPNRVRHASNLWESLTAARREEVVSMFNVWSNTVHAPTAPGVARQLGTTKKENRSLASPIIPSFYSDTICKHISNDIHSQHQYNGPPIIFGDGIMPSVSQLRFIYLGRYKRLLTLKVWRDLDESRYGNRSYITRHDARQYISMLYYQRPMLLFGMFIIDRILQLTGLYNQYPHVNRANIAAHIVFRGCAYYTSIVNTPKLAFDLVADVGYINSWDIYKEVFM